MTELEEVNALRRERGMSPISASDWQEAMDTLAGNAIRTLGVPPSQDALKAIEREASGFITEDPLTLNGRLLRILVLVRRALRERA